MEIKIPMQIQAKLFDRLPKREKSAVRAFDFALRDWEIHIHREARMANGMLQKRRRDPHDWIVSGAVMANVSYWPKETESGLSAASRKPVVQRRYNCTIIRDDDPFGEMCRMNARSETDNTARYFIGPMPCCFLLHDLCEAIKQKLGIFSFDELLTIGEVQCDLQIQLRFCEEVAVGGNDA